MIKKKEKIFLIKIGVRVISKLLNRLLHCVCNDMTSLKIRQSTVITSEAK